MNISVQSPVFFFWCFFLHTFSSFNAHSTENFSKELCSHWGIRQSGQIFSVAYTKQLLFKGRVMGVCILQWDMYVNILLLAIGKLDLN